MREMNEVLSKIVEICRCCRYRKLCEVSGGRLEVKGWMVRCKMFGWEIEGLRGNVFWRRKLKRLEFVKEMVRRGVR